MSRKMNGFILSGRAIQCLVLAPNAQEMEGAVRVKYPELPAVAQVFRAPARSSCAVRSRQRSRRKALSENPGLTAGLPVHPAIAGRSAQMASGRGDLVDRHRGRLAHIRRARAMAKSCIARI